MSVESKYYAIVGYDLTGCETDKFKDWKWTDEGEKYTCNQVKDRIQIFYDPMSGMHLYLGYILGCGDQYETETTKINLKDINDKVDWCLTNLLSFRTWVLLRRIYRRSVSSLCLKKVIK